jgi:S-adenosylmethionine:diacylglycerol 3-amino-3-carboxypropyl transferase
MNEHQPNWGSGSRFYLPNEDAAVVCTALGLIDREVRRPVFVGGSGMVLLEAAACLPRLEMVTYVDIAPFQLDYFRKLLDAIALAESPDGLRKWFGRAVYPELRDHYRMRNREYGLDRVMRAMAQNFGVSFFFDPEKLRRVRETSGMARMVRDEIVSYLERQSEIHDFIYLSNVPDYLSGTTVEKLFAACRARGAPIYLLETSACPDRPGLRRAWERAGFEPHPASDRLNLENRGLGSIRLDRDWNRPGSIYLLMPKPI